MCPSSLPASPENTFDIQGASLYHNEQDNINRHSNKGNSGNFGMISLRSLLFFSSWATEFKWVSCNEGNTMTGYCSRSDAFIPFQFSQVSRSILIHVTVSCWFFFFPLKGECWWIFTASSVHSFKHFKLLWTTRSLLLLSSLFYRSKNWCSGGWNELTCSRPQGW